LWLRCCTTRDIGRAMNAANQTANFDHKPALVLAGKLKFNGARSSQTNARPNTARPRFNLKSSPLQPLLDGSCSKNFARLCKNWEGKTLNSIGGSTTCPNRNLLTWTGANTLNLAVPNISSVCTHSAVWLPCKYSPTSDGISSFTRAEC